MVYQRRSEQGTLPAGVNGDQQIVKTRFIFDVPAMDAGIAFEVRANFGIELSRARQIRAVFIVEAPKAKIRLSIDVGLYELSPPLLEW